jgi:D-alanyl-D-alanine carboxypeptidase
MIHSNVRMGTAGRSASIGVAVMLLIAPLGTVGATGPGDAAAARRSPSTSDLAAVAARYRSRCASPGAAIGIRERDGTRRFASAGELAPGAPLIRDSQFLAGSVTKLFVATVAYQLVHEGRLSLRTKVSRLLPDWPRGDRITVAMLLGHRSGMGDFGNDFGAQLRELVLADLTRVFSYSEVLDLVRAVPPVAEPGATHHYSNANTIVLGAMVQRLTGHRLGRLIERRILRPLHLRRTIYGPDDLRRAAEVTFHGLFDVSGNGTALDIGAFPRAAALTVDPAGAGLFSTVPDLLTFTHALFGTARLLPRGLRQRLARSVSTLDARALLLGHRFRIRGHGGASPGAQVIAAYDDRSRTTVVAWCNRLDPGPNELLASTLAARDTFGLAARAVTWRRRAQPGVR